MKLARTSAFASTCACGQSERAKQAAYARKYFLRWPTCGLPGSTLRTLKRTVLDSGRHCPTVRMGLESSGSERNEHAATIENVWF